MTLTAEQSACRVPHTFAIFECVGEARIEARRVARPTKPFPVLRVPTQAGFAWSLVPHR